MSLTPELSGASFALKYGQGFQMASLLHDAHKAAGLDLKALQYAPHYSEENVYHLIDALLEYNQVASLDELVVLYISNPVKKVQLWKQKDGAVDEGMTGHMTRPYHVVLLQTPGSKGLGGPPSSQPSYIWDLDSDVPLPCRAAYYAANVLRVTLTATMADRFERFYRLVPAAVYKAHFASDRAHHREGRQEEGDPLLHAPPPWPTIKAKDGSTSTVGKYWDCYRPTMPWQQQDASSPWGLLMSEAEILHYLHIMMPR